MKRLNKIISRLSEMFAVLIPFNFFLLNFFFAKYWEGKMIRRLNDIFIVSISILFYNYWKENVPFAVHINIS